MQYLPLFNMNVLIARPLMPFVVFLFLLIALELIIAISFLVKVK